MRRTTAVSLCLFLGLISIGLLVKAGVLQVPTGTWAPGGAMAQPRVGASAVRLPNGSVLITAGPTGARPTVTADSARGDATASPASWMAASSARPIPVPLR